MLNLFLNTHVDQKWKDKYVKAHISLSGVYAGAGQVIYSLVGINTIQTSITYKAGFCFLLYVASNFNGDWLILILRVGKRFTKAFGITYIQYAQMWYYSSDSNCHPNAT